MVNKRRPSTEPCGTSYIHKINRFVFTLIISIAYVNFNKKYVLNMNACKNGFNPHGFIPNFFKRKKMIIFSLLKINMDVEKFTIK
jgi:hypothetical protein